MEDKEAKIGKYRGKIEFRSLWCNDFVSWQKKSKILLNTWPKCLYKQKVKLWCPHTHKDSVK